MNQKNTEFIPRHVCAPGSHAYAPRFIFSATILTLFLIALPGCQKAKSGLRGTVTIRSKSIEKGKIQFIGKTSNMVFESEIIDGKYKFNEQVAEGEYLVKVEIEGETPSEFEQQEILSANETTRNIKVNDSKSKQE